LTEALRLLSEAYRNITFVSPRRAGRTLAGTRAALVLYDEAQPPLPAALWDECVRDEARPVTSDDLRVRPRRRGLSAQHSTYGPPTRQHPPRVLGRVP
jgi:hypothetical protein